MISISAILKFLAQNSNSNEKQTMLFYNQILIDSYYHIFINICSQILKNFYRQIYMDLYHQILANPFIIQFKQNKVTQKDLA